MGAIKVPTNFNIDLEFEIPEFYRRLVAFLIDFIVLFFYLKIVGLIIEGMAGNRQYWDEDGQRNLFALQMILHCPIFLYYLLMEITTNGRSVGKLIMNLQVVSENGGRPSISQFVIRWLLRDIWFIYFFFFGMYLISVERQTEGLFVLLLSIGYFITDVILVVSSKKGQRIGDILAHTILISTNTKSTIEETVFQEVSENYVPSFPEIMRLSDRDINAIKSILETARKKADYYMATNAAEKIKGHLNIQTSMSPFDFLEILLKDYNYLSTK